MPSSAVVHFGEKQLLALLVLHIVRNSDKCLAYAAWRVGASRLKATA